MLDSSPLRGVRHWLAQGSSETLQSLECAHGQLSKLCVLDQVTERSDLSLPISAAGGSNHSLLGLRGC